MEITYKRKPPTNGNKDVECFVFIDGVMVGESCVFQDNEKVGSLRVYIEKIQLIEKYRISEFVGKLFQISLPIFDVDSDLWDWVYKPPHMTIFFKDVFEKGFPFAMIDTKLNLREWDRPFSPLSLLGKIESVCDGKEIEFYFDESDSTDDGFALDYLIIDTSMTIGEVFKNFKNQYREIINTSIDSAYVDLRKKYLGSVFRFPVNIRTAGEQYLSYFSQFLKDFGIDNEAIVEARLKDTLLTVRPLSSDAKLSDIQNVLNVFLLMPCADMSSLKIPSDADISIKELVLNLHHIKSLLLHSEGRLEEQNATIESLKMTNYQQKILLDSIGEENKSVDLFGGLVTIKQYEGNGFTINFPKIFDFLKRRI